ncbi:MAG TPA: 30S ribosomal protein S6 [Patescibacteria group bacterium]|jgi:small subunit ribosomal protein S6|nr:30S ribosomal protein S6 [Patescibacteria group bacterium]
MKTYQLVLVLKTSVTEANRKKFIETIKGWFGDAKVTKEEEWGEKTLAYEIKHEKTGFYLNFLLESVKIPADLEKKLFASENVLRHLVIKV